MSSKFDCTFSKYVFFYNSAYLSVYPVYLLLQKYILAEDCYCKAIHAAHHQTCHVLLNIHYIKQIFQIYVVVLNKVYFCR